MNRLRLGLLLCSVIFIGCDGLKPNKPSTAENSPTPPEQPSVDLLSARANFKTTVRPNPNYKTDGPVDQPPRQLFNIVKYPSPVGELAAYMSPEPKDGKKYPVVIYAHGGFGGINGFEFGAEEFAPLRDAGFLICCPSWRGENVNPGQFELFYGEVDDAVACAKYVAGLKYVDASRIYMLGHSTGGTITMLTAEANAPIRAAFSFGGCPDFTRVDYGNTPFDRSISQEVTLRSPINFVKHLKIPTFYFEGNRDPDGQEDLGYLMDAKRMQTFAETAKAPFQMFMVDGGTHFNIVQPICRMLARKLKADTGPTCDITITADEVNTAFKTAGRR